MKWEEGGGLQCLQLVSEVFIGGTSHGNWENDSCLKVAAIGE